MTSLTEGTNNPLQRVSTNDQLAAIVNFLDELEIKTPIKHFQRETEGNKALLDTINSLISVVRVTRLPCPTAGSSHLTPTGTGTL